MIDKGKPTRQQLLAFRARHVVITKGLDLLKSKREALMKEFFGIVEEAVRLRDDLAALMARGHRNLERTRALQEQSLYSFINSARREISLDVTVKNIWGVNVPEIEQKPMVRSLVTRDVSPIGESAGVVATARDFETIVDMLLKIASRETRLQRMGEAIKADTRKVNAISEVMLPALEMRIKVIERVLDERERESVFRLKRYKGKPRSTEG
jgi:V/A-type H+-transporting ATPase subunit D